MNRDTASAAVRIAAFAAVFFKLVMALLSFNDYLTRPIDLKPYRALPWAAAPR
jgi:hypothetical protein